MDMNTFFGGALFGFVVAVFGASCFVYGTTFKFSRTGEIVLLERRDTDEPKQQL